MEDACTRGMHKREVLLLMRTFIKINKIFIYTCMSLKLLHIIVEICVSQNLAKLGGGCITNF